MPPAANAGAVEHVQRGILRFQQGAATNHWIVQTQGALLGRAGEADQLLPAAASLNPLVQHVCQLAPVSLGARQGEGLRDPFGLYAHAPDLGDEIRCGCRSGAVAAGAFVHGRGGWRR
jgi:hypothetical protein